MRADSRAGLAVRRADKRLAVVFAIVTAMVLSTHSGHAFASGVGFVSDDFFAGFDESRWTVVDPIGDGNVIATGQGTPDASASLTVPAGTSHDPWGANQALRLLQDMPDDDFELEVKFESLPSEKYQAQGLMVEQDADNWLRFDIYSNGSSLRAFAASTAGGNTQSRLSRTISATGPVWLRVARTGDEFSFSWSDDGDVFAPVGTFTEPLSVAAVGPFASNHTPSPAFTTVVDYVFDTGAPVEPEDGTGSPDTTPPSISDVAVTTTDTTATVTWTTDEPATSAVDYGTTIAYGATEVGSAATTDHEVVLTDLDPDTTYHYVTASTDNAGNTATTSDATFTTNAQPPASYTLTSTTVGQGSVSTDPVGPDHPAGTTATLTATPSAGWVFGGWSSDVSSIDNPLVVTMDADTNVTATFVEAVDPGGGQGSFVSDDFSTGLDGSRWWVVDPVSDGTVTGVGAGTADAVLELSVPAGSSHNPWGANQALRLLQDMPDDDFELEVKFESLPSEKYQAQGLMVEQDADNWLRFDIYSNGSSLRAFAASTAGGNTQSRLSRTISATGPVWLRVARTGDEFSFSWSDDGDVFAPVGTFTEPLSVAAVGPFASNHTPSPAFTTVVDYVFDTGAPVEPEDGTGSPDTTPPSISDVAVTTTDTTATVTWTTDEPATSAVDYGTTIAYGATEVGSAATTDHEVVLTDLDPDTTYHYVTASTDNAGNTATTSDATFTTNAQPPASYTLTSTTVGQGSVSTDPVGPDHPAGTTATLTATPSAGWVFGGWSSDVSSIDNPLVVTMDADTNVTATFVEAVDPGGGQGSFVSDDFSTGLDGSRWWVVDPVSDGTVTGVGAGTADAVLELSVPAGSSHNPWGANQALRLLQDMPDDDFELEVKFESLPSEKYQAQGLMVEQDADNWLRFDIYSNGSSLRAFAASTAGGNTQSRLSRTISATGPVWLRVARTGDEFSFSWSDDGDVFAPVGTFTEPLSVAAVGPFASNHTPSPAFTTVVDYVFDTGAPVEPEDGTGSPDTTPPSISDVAVTTTDTTATVTWTTDEPATSAVDYGTTIAYGATEVGSAATTDHEVVLTDLDPDTTYHYVTASTDNAGNTATTSDATFTTNAQPPASYTLTSTTVGQGSVSTDPVGPDHPAGTTATLTATPSAGWVFGGWSSDVSSIDNPLVVTMDADTNVTATFVEAVDPGGGQGSFVSDDFSTGLDGSRWWVVDPVSDGTVTGVGAGTADAVLELSVPAGSSHNPWGANQALRLLQDMPDDDFELEVKFESLPSEKYQAQGLMVEQDADNWLRFDIYSNGSSLRAFAASTAGGNTQSRLSRTISATGPVWLRVARTGDEFSFSWSDDGDVFAPVGTFTEPLSVAAVGPFASNHTPSPAFTTVVDYVFDTGAPVEPEDGTGSPDTTPPSISDVAVTTTDTTATVTWTTDEPATSAVDYGTTIAYGATEVGSAATTDHEVVLTDLDPDTTYHYVTASTDNAGNTATTSDATFTTNAQPPASYTLTSTTVGQGSVSTDPVGPDHPAGTTATLTATPSAGWVFGGWSSDVSSIDNPLVVTMDADTNVTATFVQQPPQPPTVDVWYGDTQVVGANGRPQRWANVLGNVSDPDGISSLSYSLNNGPNRPLSTGPDLRRLQFPGDFNVELDIDDLLVGPNTVAITAVDGQGETTERQVELILDDGTTPSVATTIDWGASSGDDPNALAQVVDGKWRVEGDTLRTVELGYDRLVAVGDQSWTDYEVTYPVTVHGLGPDAGTPFSGAPLLGMGLRWRGHEARNNEQPRIEYYPIGAYAWHRWMDWGGSSQLIGTGGSPAVGKNQTLQFGTEYTMKARVETVADGARYRFKIWPSQGVEPDWQMDMTSSNGHSAGSVVLIAHHVDVSIGTIEINPIN